MCLVSFENSPKQIINEYLKGNLDEVLDSKLTLSDYQITEIYVVAKGCASLTQAFSSNDIMALRKEEERKQMHHKTGGGVFNLIFKKGKSSMGSGSISSDTRSISPTHSDDSRSVTPPAIQQKIIISPKKEPPPPERPKPPQRKRKPAPRPPGQSTEDSRRNSEAASRISNETPRSSEESRVQHEENGTTSEEKLLGTVPEMSELRNRHGENGLTISHSRNSSDSSGYHEASVLSENGNTSLPRRPKSAFVNPRDLEKGSKMLSQSTTNLSKMACHSKSTTSLGLAGRKKKSAPPPPPAVRASNPAINVVEIPSPVVVASQPSVYQQESFSSQQALDSLVSISSSPSINIAEVKKEDKFFGSTDSGIAQEIVEKLSESEEVPPGTPPPPPILEDLPQSADLPESVRKFEENTRTVHKELEAEKVDAASSKVDIEPEERLITPIIVPKEFIDTKHIEETEDIDWQYQIPSPPKAFKDSSPNYFNETPKSDCKDSVVTSPELFEKLKIIEDSQFDRETVISDVSSVVSEEEKPLCNNLSLENLEKRKSLVYNRELTTSLKMDSDLMHKSHEPYDSFSSSLSKFESTLIEIQNSSHNKNAQSLKYTQKTVTQSTNTLPNFKISTYDTPKQKIKVFEDDTVRSNTENFTKKGTYDQVSTKTAPLLARSFLGRSMENIAFKPPRDISSNYNKEEYRYLGTESSFSKNFGPTQSVFRSESFSSETSPSRPVSRSKSQLSLNANKHKERQIQNSNTNISRSNSFYDGLQSLGVMRRIQNKLSTPTSSMENINEYNKYQNSSYAIPETKPDAIASQKRIGSQKPTSPRSPVAKETTPVQEITFSRAVSIETTIADSVPPTSGSSATSFTESLPPVQKEEQPKPSEKVYKYRGPPTISMTTWSERPKVPVNIKEDADYKLSNHNVNSKLIVNTTNNDVTSNNTIEIKNNFNAQVNDSNGVSIKVNGSEGINGNKYQQGGNVVIKINGDTRPKTIDNQRFISHTTAAGYRKPFSTINSNQRPHSIAFDSDFDISRVPVVRSFELKKPYKDMGNTSVTQIYHKDDQIPYGTLRRSEPLAEPGSRFSNGHTRYNESTQSSELAQRFATINNRNSYNSTNGESKEPKPVFRVNSFKPVGAAPVVRGFKQTNDFNKNRVTWHPMGNSNTLPVKPKETETSQVNSRATFSQSNLRRTDSNRTMDNGFANQDKNQPPKGVVNSFNSLPSVPKIESKAPPPPLMPKQFPSRKPVEPVVDQRDQLMSAIRNFGGKKGLKAAKI